MSLLMKMRNLVGILFLMQVVVLLGILMLAIVVYPLYWWA
jgi:hypothetical protein